MNNHAWWGHAGKLGVLEKKLEGRMPRKQMSKTITVNSEGIKAIKELLNIQNASQRNLKRRDYQNRNFEGIC